MLHVRAVEFDRPYFYCFTFFVVFVIMFSEGYVETRSMCQRLYIASKAELPRIRRSSKEPYLQVEALEDIDAAVRRQFHHGFDHFSVAGAHLSCGCGFPELPSDP